MIEEDFYYRYSHAAGRPGEFADQICIAAEIFINNKIIRRLATT